MALSDRIQEFLQRLTPLTRGSLLTELERLEICGAEIPGAAPVLEKLRAEFRKDGSTQNRVSNPSRYFFAPLEPLLIDADPDHANSGRISRGSLSPIWEWISRDLLPTMARDYAGAVIKLIAADNQREAQRVVDTFQTKVIKSLENTLGSPDAAAQARAKLATYTTSRSVHDDLTKILCVLRARDALARFNDALPVKIAKFDDAQVAKVTSLLDAFGKTHADVLPFALTLVARRLKTSVAIDPPRHQGGAEQECRRHRRHALCDRGLDGAGPAGQQAHDVACRPEEQPGAGRQGNPDRDLRHRIRLAGPHRLGSTNPSGDSGSTT